MDVLSGTTELMVTDRRVILSLGVFEEQSHRTQGGVCKTNDEGVHASGDNEGRDYDFHCGYTFR